MNIVRIQTYAAAFSSKLRLAPILLCVNLLNLASLIAAEGLAPESTRTGSRSQSATAQPPKTKTQPNGHWAFNRVARPELPNDLNPPRSQNPIDLFVLARLRREGLQASPEADRPTLLRRLSLDLTGLPPTLEEQEQFLQDSHPDAYERLVERLLASPHYGERAARHWLDVARYADSNGYSIDAPRSLWKYRDWVIAAFNRDLPFDQFIVEQLAGDLLPEPTLEQ